MSVNELAPWLHNVHLPDGRQTAPDHPLGDWPRRMWRRFSDHLPADMEGMRALDIGCNAGFYSFEMARRGAHVVGVDPNPRYLRQAAWLANELGLEDQVVFRQKQVYELATWEDRFDVVLFLGLFYHLRYPMLGLDIAARLCTGQFVFQSLSYGPAGDGHAQAPSVDVTEERDFLAAPDWPKMAFIEGSLYEDATNWWVPERQTIPALLRSAGLQVDRCVDGFVYLCSPSEHHRAAEPELMAATGQDWRAHAGGMFDPVQGTLESPFAR